MNKDDYVSHEMDETQGSYQSQSSKSSFSIAREETRAVKLSKTIVVVILIISAAAVGLTTFNLLSTEDQEDFESKFHSFAVGISELVHHEAQNVFLSASALSSDVTSFALATKAIWPFVSMPHFESRGSASNQISKSLLTAFSPLVLNSTRREWSGYSSKNQKWIEEGVNFNLKTERDFVFKADPISKTIFRHDENGKQITENSHQETYLPVWQLAPAPRENSIVNYNLLSHPVFSRVYRGMLHTKQAVLSEVIPLDFLYGGSIRDNVTHPHSFLLQPVYKELRKESIKKEIVGTIILILPWDNYFMNLLPEDANGVVVVLGDTCDQNFTYIINGREAMYAGPGDLHDPKYDGLVFRSNFDVDHHLNVSTTKEHCEFFLNIYPSSELEAEYESNRPVLYSCSLIGVFAFTSWVFILYDFLVQRRQNKVMVAAKRANAIVSSLFPSNVRDRIMKEAHVGEAKDKRGIPLAQKYHIKRFLEGGEEKKEDFFTSQPIADLFPNATVLFGDLVGFTAWSSVREPRQVFQLLETLYHAFDNIAHRRGVFKVETIGDCYVAVAGLPEPRNDHAVVMARFARDILLKTDDLAKKLETMLGPDTGDICMRIGLNSGPVTAGVLRGEKSRFQLFGDTVNTASRMESNGERNKIHVSQETANLLQAAGKSHWLSPREDQVFAKGKGELQTYWLQLRNEFPSERSGTGTVTVTDTSETTEQFHGNFVYKLANEKSKQMEKSQDLEETESPPQSFAERMKQSGLNQKPYLSPKVERLVSWNADVMERLLKQIVARRKASSAVSSRTIVPDRHTTLTTPTTRIQGGATVLDEVKEIIELPQFDARAARKQKDPNKIILDPDVRAQLHDYIVIIATMYRDNPFHNFEHASHVTMSVVKLLSRIVAPDDVLVEGDELSGHFDKNLHDHTYGITSDPLTQFAVVFSALIHDVDHPGVPNSQLVIEQTDLAKMYNNKSVAEQNSVDIAWDLLMDDSFCDLRSVIFSNPSEMKRFRQLVVNSVMATDIVDKELKDLRNGRWDKAFHQSQQELGVVSHHPKTTPEDVNRKATIVIEHLIQASDIAHTMQHWHIYRKWNERFFQEMHHTYKSGRAEKNPAEFWYKGEMGFFDFYIIPLAKKLKDCGVFGVSCDELLNYAMANRKEWEIKGEEVVAEMERKYCGRTFTYCEEQCQLGDDIE